MKVKNALKWIALNPMELIAAAALIFSILISVTNGLTRYFIKYTWNPGTDVNTICFAYVVFCGSAAAYRRKMHYGIDVFVNMMPDAIKKAVDIVVHIVTLCALALATYLAVSLAMNVGGKIMPNTKISYFWYDMSAVIGFAYMTLYELQHTVQMLKSLGKSKKEEEVK